MAHENILFEPTSLTSLFAALAEALESSGCNVEDTFLAAGLDRGQTLVPGARYPVRKINRLIELAVHETGDPCFGLTVATHIRPTSFHALGFSWLASATVMEALERIERYMQVISTAVQLELSKGKKITTAQWVYPHPSIQPTRWAREGGFAICVRMFRLMTDDSFAPLLVTFQHEDQGCRDRFEEMFQAPVRFSADRDAMQFETRAIEAPVVGGNPDIAQANDQVAERYLASLDPNETATKVRELLLRMLPSGNASGEIIAGRLHRSFSTLQRRLREEGTNYKDLLDQTRKDLAIGYLNRKELTFTQVAYLLGFSDQASFARAFKRWTGKPPSEYRASEKLH